MGAVVTTPLVVAPADKFPVVPVANGILPDEALAITCTLQFSPAVQAILIDLSESARKFNTIPIQGAFIDTSGSAIDLRIDNSVTGQSILAKAGLQGYYNLLCPMPAKLIAVLASAPAAQLNITMILYNTVIESAVWGLTSGPAGATGPQGPPGPQGAIGPVGPQGSAGAISNVENAGTPLPVEPTLNFTGAGVTATDDSVNTRTNIIIPGYTLPVATSSVLGGVMTGINVTISGSGQISVPPTASLQTPWLSNINGAGFNLNSPGQINNAISLGLGAASNPNTPLLISSAANAAVESLTSTNPAAGAVTVSTNDTGVTMSAGVGGSTRPAASERSNGFINVYPTGDLVLETGTIERMRLTQNGDVGVGTATPLGSTPPYTSPILHIYGTAVNSANILAETTADGAGVNVQNGPGGMNKGFAGRRNDGTVDFLVGQLNLNGGNLAFYTDQAGILTERIRITPTGNVGIATGSATPPLAKLEVRGVVRVLDITPTPTSGQGLEMFYQPSATRGGVQAYDRSANQWVLLNIDGSPLGLNLISGANVIMNVPSVFNTATVGNNQLSISLDASNTQLSFYVRGSDGVLRAGHITVS